MAPQRPAEPLNGYRRTLALPYAVLSLRARWYLVYETTLFSLLSAGYTTTLSSFNNLVPTHSSWHRERLPRTQVHRRGHEHKE